MATINNITIEGIPVNFKYGLTITELLNQDLDTAVLLIPNSEELSIEPFDEVIITYETINQRRFFVGTVNSRISRYGDSFKYNYEIGLVSLTLKLQRIILPNKTITQSLDGNNDKTIKKVMQEYLAVYAPGVSLSTPLIQKLGDTICPEQQWSRPTLFEVFNDLLKPLGSVVTMTSKTVVSYLDLDEEGSIIDESYINDYQISHNIAEYSSALEIDASNVYDRTAITRTPEKYIVRTTQQGLMTTENQEVVLNKPIFEIKKVIIHFVYIDINNEWQQDSLDITNRVINKKVWDTYYPSDKSSRVEDTPTKKYCRNYIWFEEGTNLIQGLTFKEKDWIPLIDLTTFAIDNVALWSATDQNKPSYFVNAIAGVFNGFLQQILSWDVEYTTTDNLLFRVRKDIQPKHESVLINNQTNAQVYARTLGKQQQDFVNRVGNRELIVTGRYSSYNDIPNLKDKIQEYVLVKRDIQIYENYYLFKGMLSENYSYDNMFAGINTAKRYTELAFPSEAVESNHLTEFLYRVEKTDSNNIGNLSLMEKYLVENYGSSKKYIQGAIVSTMYDEDIGTRSKNLLLEVTPYLLGNSFVITLRMGDNFNSYLQMNDEYLFTNNKQMMGYVRYVDDNGRFDRIAIRLYRYDQIPANRGILIKEFTYEAQNIDQFYIFKDGSYRLAKFPVIENSYSFDDGQTTITYNPVNDSAKVFAFNNTGPVAVGGHEDYVRRYKDNREVTLESLQFTILAGEDIFLSDKFYEYLPPVYVGDQTRQFKFAYSTTLEYTKYDTQYKGSLAPLGFAEYNPSGNQIAITDISPYNFWSNLPVLKSWAICDYDGNILIAVNGDYSPIYINKE